MLEARSHLCLSALHCTRNRQRCRPGRDVPFFPIPTAPNIYENYISASHSSASCFAGLLSLAPQASLLLVASHLQSENRELVCETAIALGESRNPESFELLKAAGILSGTALAQCHLP